MHDLQKNQIVQIDLQMCTMQKDVSQEMSKKVFKKWTGIKGTTVTNIIIFLLMIKINARWPGIKENKNKTIVMRKLKKYYSCLNND